MLKLKDFLKEDKNTHMEHLEDLVFNEGVAGTRKAINFLRDLRDMLAGNSTSKITTTVKWDGAPAIFAGIDPRDGKFFVAKKGIFNKEPKVYKTAADIDAELAGELADKFKIALSEFSKLGIKSGVYQGDLMFTDDKKIEIIDDDKYVTFHPNTIVYAIPYSSELGAKIRSAKIGIVWHTTYEGKSFETMSASFGKGIVEKFKDVPSIWMDDANYKDYSGTATFTKSETAAVTKMLSDVGSMFQAMNPLTLNAISRDEDLLMQVKTYNNSKIRANTPITDINAHVTGLFNYIHDKFQKEIDTKKTQKGKDVQEEKRKKILAFFANHDKREIVKIFEIAEKLTAIKEMIINKMNEAGHISTFIKTASGFKVTGVEGFVAIDHLSGGAVKIVNRMEFSKANFSSDVIKGWQR
jgi:Family of unknown function (DUF6267)